MVGGCGVVFCEKRSQSWQLHACQMEAVRASQRSSHNSRRWRRRWTSSGVSEMVIVLVMVVVLVFVFCPWGVVGSHRACLAVASEPS